MAVTIDGTNGITSDTVDLGNTDTTLARVSAGVLSVEGNHVPSPASQAQGDILYHNGTTWARLGAGTSGNYLKTNGTGANPAWAAATSPSGTFTYIGSVTVSGTTNSDITNIGSYTTLYIISYFNLNALSRYGTVAVSANNGTSFGTAFQITTSPASATNTPVFTFATISNANVSGNKTITPYSLSNNNSTTSLGTLYTTTGTESSVTGTLNALRFTHNGGNSVSVVSVYGIS